MSSLKEASRELLVRYLEGFPAKWRVIEEALEQLRGDECEAAHSLRRLAHQIRGSAASYGLVEIDRSANRLEHAPDLASLRPAASALLDALRDAYEAQSTATTRALLIDDDPDIGHIMAALFSEDRLSIVQVESAAEATEALREDSWDLIFVDLVLPDADGRTLLTQIRALPRYRDTPLVVLSAKTSSLVKNECAIYGIDDFIAKPIDPATFPIQVASMLARARTQQRNSHSDPVTQLPNRLGLRTALDALDASERARLCLAIVDIDHLDGFEALHGRARSEEALAAIAVLLREVVREQDLLARWGGEEFLIAFVGLAALEAIDLLGQASARLRELELGREAGVALSFTVGVTEFGADQSLDHALLRADQLLHQAKRGSDNGRWYAHKLESSGDKARILIAEDDPGLASILMRDLGEDYELSYCPDGEAAIEAAETQRFDLILLDYQMPKRDGVEVVRHLRALPAYARTPILLLTAIGSDAAVEAAFAAGADDYINKPHRGRALRARLARHLGRRSAESDESRPSDSDSDSDNDSDAPASSAETTP